MKSLSNEVALQKPYYTMTNLIGFSILYWKMKRNGQRVTQLHCNAKPRTWAFTSCRVNEWTCPCSHPSQCHLCPGLELWLSQMDDNVTLLAAAVSHKAGEVLIVILALGTHPILSQPHLSCLRKGTSQATPHLNKKWMWKKTKPNKNTYFRDSSHKTGRSISIFISNQHSRPTNEPRPVVGQCRPQRRGQTSPLFLPLSRNRLDIYRVSLCCLYHLLITHGLHIVPIPSLWEAIEESQDCKALYPQLQEHHSNCTAGGILEVFSLTAANCLYFSGTLQCHSQCLWADSSDINSVCQGQF